MKFLILSGSLKKQAEISNTRAISELVQQELEPEDSVEILDLADLDFEPGTDRLTQSGDVDDFTRVLQKMLEADSVIFATPIWWGQASSLIQAIMERMTWFDDWYIKNNINALYGKTFGLIVSGTDDGWQQIYGQCFSFASLLGFTIPPEAALGISVQGPDKIARDPDVLKQVKLFVRNQRVWSELISKSGVFQIQKSSLERTGIFANPSIRV